MSPQVENLCVTGTLFLFGCSSLIVVGTVCDTWRTFVCDGVGVGNRGSGGSSNLGWRRSCLPLKMVGGKSNWVDVLVCIGIVTNIDDSSDGRIDVLNSSLSGVAKKAFRCNERGSTSGVTSTKSGSEEVGGCTDGRSEKVGDCTIIVLQCMTFSRYDRCQSLNLSHKMICNYLLE